MLDAFIFGKGKSSLIFVGICRKLSFIALVDDVVDVFAALAAAAADDNDNDKDIDRNADDGADTVHDNSQ